MATVSSFSAQAPGRQTDSGNTPVAGDRTRPSRPEPHAWPVLARIPNVSEKTGGTGQGESSAVTKPVFRFDPPQSPQPHAVSDSSKSLPAAASADSPRVTVSPTMPDATGLPLWTRPKEAAADLRPTTHPAPTRTGRRVSASGANHGPEFARSLAQFLVLVALFTAAGLSIRMMVGAAREPAAPSPRTSQATARSVAAVPTPPAHAVKQLPSVASQPARPSIAPAVVDAPVITPSAAHKPDDESAVARLPGYILEVPSRQAQHSHDEPNVH